MVRVRCGGNCYIYIYTHTFTHTCIYTQHCLLTLPDSGLPTAVCITTTCTPHNCCVHHTDLYCCLLADARPVHPQCESSVWLASACVMLRSSHARVHRTYLYPVSSLLCAVALVRHHVSPVCVPQACMLNSPVACVFSVVCGAPPCESSV